MRELDLAKHASTRAEQLSGGQLKRVNVAQELLTKPSLLFRRELAARHGPMVALAVIFVLLTWLRLRRLSPGRRR